MKRLFMKSFALVLCIVIAASVTVVGAEETRVTPRFVGINLIVSGLTINEYGRANCDCSVLVDSGYSVDVTMSLEQDGVAIKSWTGSSTTRVDLSKVYYVSSGYDYQVVVTVRVKTAGGSYLCSYTEHSPVKSY